MVYIAVLHVTGGSVVSLAFFFLPCYLQTLLQNYFGRDLVWVEKKHQLTFIFIL